MQLPWLEPTDPFPPSNNAWGVTTAAPGLLAAGGSLNIENLQRAYRQGAFPWYSGGQPILWWSPDPRMVLFTEHFKRHRSLQKTLRSFIENPRCKIIFNSAFQAVINNCANAPRGKQTGTWILPQMQQAYINLHQAGYAHSIETWVDDTLVGGLYCVAIGKAVFGESMFTHLPDASKIALAALVCFCIAHRIKAIDCQQNTQHLAFMGAYEIPRAQFLQHISQAQQEPAPSWQFNPAFWQHLQL